MSTVNEIKKEEVLSYLAEKSIAIPKAIEKQIEDIGGEDMLLQRIDVLHWVFFSRDEAEMYSESVRFLEGDKDVDLRLIVSTIQQNKDYFQNALQEITRLKDEIIKCQESLEAYEIQLPLYRKVIEVLENELYS